MVDLFFGDLTLIEIIVWAIVTILIFGSLGLGGIIGTAISEGVSTQYWIKCQLIKGRFIICNPKEAIARAFFREDHS